MLEENRKIYKEAAAKIPDIKKISKTELFNRAVENENNETYQYYISEILDRYWKSIYSCYSRSYAVSSEEECYDMLVDSVLYTLRKRVWLDEKSKLYKDPNGPDKALNINYNCLRKNKYIFANRYKRAANIFNLSTEVDSDFNQDFFDEKSGLAKEDNPVITSIPIRYYKKHDVLAAFILALLSSPEFFTLSDQSPNELARDIYESIFNEPSMEFLSRFCEDNDLDKCEVYNKFLYYKTKKESDVKSSIKKCLQRLKNDMTLKASLKHD